MTTADIFHEMTMCRCGHSEAQHTATTKRCLVCVRCVPGHPSHVAERCTCDAFKPADRCDVCTLPVPTGVETCELCLAVIGQPHRIT